MRCSLRSSTVILALGGLLAGFSATLAPCARCARADDTGESDEAVEKQEAKERKERFLKWMQTFIEGTRVREVVENGNDEDANEGIARLVPNPVFRYSDPDRKIDDATLWVWTRNDRPVAFQKLEAEHLFGPAHWTICFASLSERLLKASWPNERQYATSQPGVAFKRIPKCDSPAANARIRAVQLGELRDRFSAKLDVDTPRVGVTRTAPKALFEYSDPKSKLPLGAIYGMSAFGTNPDLLLLIEARPDGEGKLRWEYALARMTIASLEVKLDDDEVWSEAFCSPNNQVLANWTFYFLPRDVK